MVRDGGVRGPRMRRTRRGAIGGLVLIALALAGCGSTQSGEVAAPVVWSYDGDTGPQAWGSLDPAYEACGRGVEQSPIDLSLPTGEGPRADAEYVASAAEAEDTGHAEEMLPGLAQTLTVDGVEYTLANMHVHLPSEHTLDGRSFPGEAHFVHQAADGSRLVVGRFLDEGPDNAAWAPFIAAVGETGPDAPVGIDQVDWAAMVPAQSAAITYEGSLTTPPCTEGVRWFVGTEPVALGAGQLAALQAQYVDNNRPVQPLGERQVGPAVLTVD